LTEFKKSQTYFNLARSFAGECQAGMRYQLMAKIAMQEGLFKLSDLIKNIAKNETVHAATFYNERRQCGKRRDRSGLPLQGRNARRMSFVCSQRRKKRRGEDLSRFCKNR